LRRVAKEESHNGYAKKQNNNGYDSPLEGGTSKDGVQPINSTTELLEMSFHIRYRSAAA